MCVRRSKEALSAVPRLAPSLQTISMRPMSMTSTVRSLITALLFAAVTMPATAQSVTITSPAPLQRLAAGPDYATDVLGNPWDMIDRPDYGPDPTETRNLGSLRFEGGRLLGTVQNDDGSAVAQVMMLHRGYYATINTSINGDTHPVSTGLYSKLAFKLYSETGMERPAAVWYFNRIASPNDVFGQKLVPDVTEPGVGSKIFVMDLAGAADIGQPWQSAAFVKGLRLHLNGSAAAVGRTVGLDWVRLVPPDASALAVRHGIAWSGPSGGTYTLSVLELGANAALPVTIASVAGSGSGSNSFSWAYGFLPPGNYRLTIRHSGGATSSVDFNINHPPVVNVVEPDATGGEDFATVTLGNPWDMSDAADVRRVGGDNLTAVSFSGGEFHAANPPGVTGPQVWLLANTGGAVDPARYHRLTFKYRLDGAFDLTDAGGSVGRLHYGGYAPSGALSERTVTEAFLVWPGDNVYTFDLATLQLGTDQGIEAGGVSFAPATWGASIKRLLLFVAHEGYLQRFFHYDYVRLTADDETVGSQFTIVWTVLDTDVGESRTINLYYDADTNPSTGRVLIATRSAAEGSFVWNTAAVPPGVYYIYAEVTDGVNATGRYATGPVRVAAAGVSSTVAVGVSGAGSVVSSPGGISCGADCTEAYAAGTAVMLIPVAAGTSVFAGWSGSPDCLDGTVTAGGVIACTATFITALGVGPSRGAIDLNGDSGADSFRYGAGSGAWAMDFGNRAGGFNSRFGAWSAGWTVKAGDFDGNALTDFFLYSAASGQWFKALNNNAADFTYFASGWSPGWTPYVVDLNADGKSDVFIYNAANGVWFKCLSVGSGSGEFAYFGGQWSGGWDLYPADFNGDRAADFFLYSQATGQWFRATNDLGAGFSYAGDSWSPGWSIYPGDYNGDGLSDLFIYSPTGGSWYIVTNTGVSFVYSGGAWSPGWSIFPGDFNADGRYDIFLYSAAGGEWLEAFSNGSGGFTYAAGAWSPGWQVFVTDFNADRAADILLYSPTSGAYFQATNAGPGAFSYGGGNWGTDWTIVPTRTAIP